MTLITPIDLRERLDEPGTVVVDVRPLVAYNGWRQGDDARGGHVPGAVSFPIEWLESVDTAEIDRLLIEKAITPDRRDRRLRRRQPWTPSDSPRPCACGATRT